MKELYSFEVEHEGSPVKIILKKPTQRELEGGEEEYSVAISHYMRRGVMTKFMLHRQISDFGGILPDKVAKEQNDRYTEMYDIDLDLMKDSALPLEKQNSVLRAERIARLIEIKREIATVEQVYNQAYNHTAEKKAETRLAMWWFYKMIYIQRKQDATPIKYFDFESYDESQNKYHNLVEDEDVFFELFRQRALGLVGFWLNSDRPTAESMAEFDETILKILNQEQVEEEAPSEEPNETATEEFDSKKKVTKKVSKRKAEVNEAVSE